MKLVYLSLLIFPAMVLAAPCGLQGTLEERIKECAVTKENFVLVARDEKGVEVYQDVKTKLLWGNRMSMDFNHYGSQKACAESPEAVLLKDRRWRLPTVKEFEKSAANGMKASLPNMNYWFWTSTAVKRRGSRRWRRRQPAQAYLWDGIQEKTDAGDLKDAASVRCVSKG
jgi:hypothetical protein